MKKAQKKNNAVYRVRRYFPDVKKVVDARQGIQVSVTKEDSTHGRKKDPKGCALARACVRSGADGAIINIAYSYVIKGDTATRYKTSATVAREITSFDRHQDFAVGKDYLLARVAPASRLGFRKRTPKSMNKGPKLTEAEKPVVHYHRTSRIRVSKTD